MTTKEVYSNLCYYDTRHPDWWEALEPRIESCSCDNCFHGRHNLALEIIKMRELLETTIGSYTLVLRGMD